MSNPPPRFERNIRLFGEEGQRRLRVSHVVVAGVGGNGTHVIQQLALLGVGQVSLIDDEELSGTNRNRYIGAWHDDPIPGSKKVALGARLINLIDPTITVVEIPHNLLSKEAFAAVSSADHVFGCFDHDGPRHVLNELSSAYAKPYIDLASDVSEDGVYGGRVFINWDGNGCLHCLGLLDEDAVRHFLASDAERENEAAIYGVDQTVLGGTGPSVVSVNGVVASLAVTEYMVTVTGMRTPTRLLTYRGDVAKVTVSLDPPQANCYYCKAIRGLPEHANVERYLRSPNSNTAAVDAVEQPRSIDARA